MRVGLFLLAAMVVYILARIAAIAIIGASALGYAGYLKLNDVFRRFEWNLQDQLGERNTQRRRDEMLNSIEIDAEPQKNREERTKLMAEAMKLTRLITTAVKLLQNATRTCYDLQVFIARTFGYPEMAEVDAHPEAVRTRQQVLDLANVAIELMEHYPKLFSDSKLLQQLVGLKAMLAICADCQLLRYSLATVPRICDPSRMMGNRPSAQAEQQ